MASSRRRDSLRYAMASSRGRDGLGERKNTITCNAIIRMATWRSTAYYNSVRRIARRRSGGDSVRKAEGSYELPQRRRSARHEHAQRHACALGGACNLAQLETAHGVPIISIAFGCQNLQFPKRLGRMHRPHMAKSQHRPSPPLGLGLAAVKAASPAVSGRAGSAPFVAKCG
jgi:hypothetical protein